MEASDLAIFGDRRVSGQLEGVNSRCDGGKWALNATCQENG